MPYAKKVSLSLLVSGNASYTLIPRLSIETQRKCDKHLCFSLNCVRLFYNYKIMSLKFLFQVISIHLHGIQLLFIHLSCKVTFIICTMIICTMKQLTIVSFLFFPLPSSFLLSPLASHFLKIQCLFLLK